MSRLCGLLHSRSLLSMRCVALLTSFDCCPRGRGRHASSSSQETVGARWKPLVLKYLENASSTGHPAVAALVATVCHHIQEFDVGYIAEVLHEATERHGVDCTPALGLLVQRLSGETGTCSSHDLDAVSKLCELLRGNESTWELANAAFSIAAERIRKATISPAMYASIVWSLREHIQCSQLAAVPDESFLRDAVTSQLSLVPTLQCVAVCHDSVDVEYVRSLENSVRDAWTAGELSDDEMNTSLCAMLRFVELAEHDKADALRPVARFCVAKMDVSKLRADVAAAAILVAVPVTEVDILARTLVEHCSCNITAVDDLILPLITAVCSSPCQQLRDRSALLMATSLSQADSVSPACLARMCNAVLLNKLFATALLDGVVVAAQRSLATWNSSAMAWGSLANLLLCACHLSKPLVEAAISRLLSYRKHALPGIGGIMYWLWAASVTHASNTHQLLHVLAHNPMDPLFKRDRTLHLLHELQWMHCRQGMAFHGQLDQQHLSVSRRLAERIASVYGRRAFPLAGCLLHSRPVWCAAFLLGDRRQMKSWEAAGIHVNSVTAARLAECELHTVAVAAEPDADPELLARSKVDLAVWRATVEAHGWQVVLVQQSQVQTRTDRGLRHLISQQANIR